MTKNLNTIVKWVHDSYHGQYKTIGQASEEVRAFKPNAQALEGGWKS